MIVKTLQTTGQFMDCGIIVDCFNFNLERKIFIPKCLGLFFFSNVILFYDCFKKSLSFIGNSKSALI